MLRLGELKLRKATYSHQHKPFEMLDESFICLHQSILMKVPRITNTMKPRYPKGTGCVR